MDKRFYSLDVFRGATVAFMILVNNLGSWAHIYPPLEHAQWNGCTPTDLVFPFFLFAVGNAMAFVMPKLQEGGDGIFLKKVVKRTLLILGIGLFLNWFPFIRWVDGHYLPKYWVNPADPSMGVRILGVLQRIALCYFFASLFIYYFKIRGAFIISLLLLLGYWAACFLLGKQGDPYSLQGYFGLAVDKSVLGIPHMYKGEGVPFDPEGLASTLPAIVQVIAGYFVGHYIIQKGKTSAMLARLLFTGCILVAIGYCWNILFPLNKKIWTSSFVVYTSGLAILVLGLLIYIIELQNYRGKWSKFFDVFGKNPLFIFVLSGLIPRISGLIHWVVQTNPDGSLVYTSPLEWFYEHICKPVSGNLQNGSLLYAVITVFFYWLLGYWLDRKKIYIKV